MSSWGFGVWDIPVGSVFQVHALRRCLTLSSAEDECSLWPSVELRGPREPQLPAMKDSSLRGHRLQGERSWYPTNSSQHHHHHPKQPSCWRSSSVSASRPPYDSYAPTDMDLYIQINRCFYDSEKVKLGRKIRNGLNTWCSLLSIKTAYSLTE